MTMAKRMTLLELKDNLEMLSADVETARKQFAKYSPDMLSGGDAFALANEDPAYFKALEGLVDMLYDVKGKVDDLAMDAELAAY